MVEIVILHVCYILMKMEKDSVLHFAQDGISLQDGDEYGLTR